MAGRFFRDEISWTDYQARLPVVPPPGIDPPERQANIAPSMVVPVIRHVPEGDGPDRQALELGPVLWGLIPDWFRGRFEEWKRPAFNARAEDAPMSNLFKGAFRYRRCLIPVHGYYVWEGVPGNKTRYAVASPRADWFCLAGIWERALIDGASYDGLAMLTTTPNDVVAGLSARMPVIIGREDYHTWLTGGLQEAARLMRPFPSAGLTAWPSLEGYPVWP